MQLDLVRDLLDKQLIDRNGTKMGRVDGVIVHIDDGQQPRVHHLQLGFVVLARRIHPMAEKIVNAFRRRVRVREEAVQDVSWDVVGEIQTTHIKVDIDSSETPAFAWEKWLRDHVVTKLPGAGD